MDNVIQTFEFNEYKISVYEFRIVASGINKLSNVFIETEIYINEYNEVVCESSSYIKFDKIICSTPVVLFNELNRLWNEKHGQKYWFVSCDYGTEIRAGRVFSNKEEARELFFKISGHEHVLDIKPKIDEYTI